MDQEITIIVVIDSAAAISENRLDNHIYMIDNLRAAGSQGIGTPDLITAANGFYWFDGSMASEPLFNWLIVNVGSLPRTLPRSYHEDRSKAHDLQILRDMKAQSDELETDTNTGILPPSIGDIREKLRILTNRTGRESKLKNAQGGLNDIGLKLLDMRGQIISRGEESTAQMSYLPPYITNITGEAVDEGILYPAQYGTPIAIKDGWYWSATASTHKPGLYSYTMHIRLFKFIWGADGEVIWEPVDMTHQAKIRITRQPMRNGFTHAGNGMLPIHY